MKTSKNFSQKGHGLLEYAFLFGFVAAVFLIAFSDGGIGDTLGNLFGSSSDSVASVEFNGGKSGGASSGSNSGANGTSNSSSNSSSVATSTTSETATAEESTPATYKTLNWQEIDMGVQGMYGTVLRSDTPDKAIVSEINLFGDVSAMVEGHLASTKAEDGLKDWQNFMSNIEKTQRRNNFKSSYKRGEETVTIERVGNSNAVQIKYADKENAIYYKLSPDANNVMQVETNSHKSYKEFFSSITNGVETGWVYNK